MPGEAHDTYGYPCPVICSSLVKSAEKVGEEERHTSGAIQFRRDGSFSVDFPGAARPHREM